MNHNYSKPIGKIELIKKDKNGITIIFKPTKYWYKLFKKKKKI